MTYTPDAGIDSAGAAAGTSVSMAGAVVQTTNLLTPLVKNNAANVYVDTQGKLITTEIAREQIINQYTTIDNTSDNTIVTAVASEYHDLRAIYITNNTLSDMTYTIKDDGTTKFLAKVNGGEMVDIIFPYPLTAAGANTNWTTTANITGTSSYVTAITSIYL